jgi:hypothetical protein
MYLLSNIQIKMEVIMSKKIYIAVLMIITLSVYFSAVVKGSFAIELQSVPGQVIKIERLTKDQFNALPDNAVIEVNGVQMTKQQLIMANKQKKNELINQLKLNVPKTQVEAAQTKFLQEQKNKLDAENARIKSAFESQVKLTGTDSTAKFTAIQKEAIELFTKSKNATPAEQQQIEQRAKELTEQLKLMGY